MNIEQAKHILTTLNQTEVHQADAVAHQIAQAARVLATMMETINARIASVASSNINPEALNSASLMCQVIDAHSTEIVGLGVAQAERTRTLFRLINEAIGTGI